MQIPRNRGTDATMTLRAERIKKNICLDKKLVKICSVCDELKSGEKKSLILISDHDWARPSIQPGYNLQGSLFASDIKI